MSRFLQALAYVAPGAALRRAQALAVIEAQRAYDGATRGRRGSSFNARGTSANSEIGPALSTLRDRSRHLGRNTWAGARILDVTVGHAVGTGIHIVPNTGSDRVDNKIKSLLAEWIPQADVEGELDLHGLIALAVRTMLEGGEGLLRLVPRKHGSRTVPLALQLLEGDFLDAAREGTIEGHRSRLGVALGDWNERTGYWLHPQHPGEMLYQPLTRSGLQSTFVPRSEVIHLYKPTRPGQLRGVPVFAPVLLTAQDLADLGEAIVIKTRIEACFSAFVKTDTAPTSIATASRTDSKGRRIEEIQPGMVNYLQPGEDVTFATPSGTGQFEAVWLATLMAMAAGAGVTYDQISGDLRQANYSSLRAGKIEFRRLIEQLQWLTIIPKVYQRITGAFVDYAILAGALPDRRDGYRFDYVPPANEPIDPKKDLEADILAVRAGRLAPQEFIAAWGRDWREVVADYATFLKEIDRQGLVFDIDPRRTNQIGATQTAPGEAAPAAAA